MRYIIDRFEGDYAILEDENRKMTEILINKLPSNVKEGTVLAKSEDGYVIDLTEEELRKERIKKLENDIWE